MTKRAELVRAILSSQQGRRIWVVGDVILDRFHQGSVPRLSPEAPVPVFAEGAVEGRLGGAANVAMNIASLGAQVQLFGCVGDDPEAQELKAMLSETPIAVGTLLTDPDRPTSRKARFIARGQTLLRVDRELAQPLSEPMEQRLCAALRDSEAPHVIVVSDYAKGVITEAVMAELAAVVAASDAELIVDPKRSDLAFYEAANVITPNRAEFLAAAGLDDDAPLEDQDVAANRLVAQLGLDALVVTRDSDGISTYVREGLGVHEPTRAREVFDVTGAGDTVVSTLAAMRAGGAAWPLASWVANTAGGVAVTQRGTSVVRADRLEAAVREREPSPAGSRAAKLFVLPTLTKVLERLRRSGDRVVFTNGCFDLLHPGHIRLLQAARAEGDFLIVGLNNDDSVRRLKGTGRPLLNEQARAQVLSALACVDAVVLFGADTPLDLIVAVEPDVLVKGSDYQPHEVVGRAEVEARGGRLVLIPLEPGHSTTDLVRRAAIGGED